MRPYYIWQYPGWPKFSWESDRILNPLSEVRLLEGRIAGMMSGLGFDIQSRTSLGVMTEDVIRSNEIEGILLNADRVRSSVARHLGISIEGLPEPDHYTDGVVQVMIDAVRNYSEELTENRLFNWHAALFPTGRSGIHPITVAGWSVGEEPMQVVSGALGKEKVHYEAPASADVPKEMALFRDWVNNEKDTDSVLKAAIAHLWFVTIHPFDDGNGRMARTITDMLLARADGMPHRYYSMSAEILRNKNGYYDALERTTIGDVDITLWLEWFLRTLKAAMERSVDTVDRVVKKSMFWQKHRDVAMNERQVKIVNQLWYGFEGKLTSVKWAKICKTSQATALRDINDLIGKGILMKGEDGSKNTNYILVED
ncbi:MAG: Fic family protein [Candidatus Cryptobacteroides sp.]